MKKIILISPFPPAQNPRLIKEYQALKAIGYNVKVWYAERDRWAANFADKNTDFVLVGGKYGSVFYYFTRLIHKTLKNVLPANLGLNRVSWLLHLKAITQKSDLYIAHNSAALPIAVIAAQWHKTKCGFDAEDFHRQETTDNQASQHYKTVKYLEDKYFGQLNYMTAASPLIGLAYKKLYPQISSIIINNVFSGKFVKEIKPYTDSKTLKLFWFSQTVGKNRGLETVIQAIGILNEPNISLTLLGMISETNEIYFKTHATQKGLQKNQLFFLRPVPPDTIFSVAAQYDIGLALELSTPFNRDICLTNKIFTYLTAGLAIIASETAAQKQFITENPSIGKSFEIGDIAALANIINFYFKNKQELFHTKKNAQELVRNKFNWEIESEKFLQIIKSI